MEKPITEIIEKLFNKNRSCIEICTRLGGACELIMFNKNRSCIEMWFGWNNQKCNNWFNKNRSCIEIIIVNGGLNRDERLIKTEVVLKYIRYFNKAMPIKSLIKTEVVLK